ncbi:hypothetical protein SLEP1_g24089 [Rubroshorea leprosula]|uniref:RNase H type-1 domain-containing protein n=1 Tax=Rubroshorea leprosula TaxID=152421 RepID=A0AAV5JP02_9ROSI|nr:hypothetical protein SLEP1_g24089 [Rubroshorea leprosula]
MCKLNWRLHSEKSNTWSKLFCRKYSIVDPRDPLPNHGSPTLQAMKEGRSLFQRGLRWIPRNGNSIFFWNDCWVGNQPLSKVFYGPHLPSSDSVLLADVLLDGSTSGIAYHLPQELLAQMQAIPIATNTTLEDNFSPSSALCLLRDLPTTKDCTWSWIWKVVTLPKIQFFIWLLSHCRLKSLAFLHRLNISPSPNCPRCHDAEETIDHIFRGCPLSIHLWNLLLPGAIVPGEYSTFTSWLKANLDVNTSLQSWSTSITFRAIDFWSSIPPPVALKTRTQGLFAWSKPSFGCIKLNTDGASEGNPGPAGAGGVFRDHLGNFIIGFSRKVGFATSLAAELWAIRDGLLIAIHRGFNNLIVESDSKTAISMITAGSYNCHHLSTLILDCRELLRQFENIQIGHAVRECNMTADCFARMGTTLSSPSFCIFESCPPSAAFFCCADAYGLQQPTVEKFDGATSDPDVPQSYSNKLVVYVLLVGFQGKLSVVPGTNLPSIQAGEEKSNSDSGLSCESEKHLDFALCEDILENCTLGMESIQYRALVSFTEPNTMGQLLSNNFPRRQEFRGQPQMQEEYQVLFNCVCQTLARKT